MNKEEFLKDVEANVKFINEKILEGLSVNKLAPEFFNCREDNVRKWLKEARYTRDKNSKLFVVKPPTSSSDNVLGNINTTNYKPVTENNKSSYEPVIKSHKSAYDIENQGMQEDEEVMKITLMEFKDLSIEEKIKVINERAMGKKNLKELSETDFDFNVSNHMNQYHKNQTQWDGDIKCYKLVGVSQELHFSSDDIKILKAFIERQKAIKQLIEDENKGEDKVHSIRCYTNIYNRFKEACEAQNIRIQDALAIALIDYINK